jgi:hypothetical protein
VLLFTLSAATVVQLLLTVFMPIAVGLVTTKTTSPALKTVMLALLTLVTSLLVELAKAIANGTNYDLGVALLAAIPAFAISVSMHYGLWKPTGASEAAQRVEPTTLLR